MGKKERNTTEGNARNQTKPPPTTNNQQRTTHQHRTSNNEQNGHARIAESPRKETETTSGVASRRVGPEQPNNNNASTQPHNHPQPQCTLCSHCPHVGPLLSVARVWQSSQYNVGAVGDTWKTALLMFQFFRGCNKY